MDRFNKMANWALRLYVVTGKQAHWEEMNMYLREAKYYEQV